ncbi:MAG: amidohydrolase family protein [Pseudomonadales bacterium]
MNDQHTEQYANNRILYDADSHIMELPDFLQQYAEPDQRELVPEISFGTAAGSGIDRDLHEYIRNGRAHDPATVSELVALGPDLLRGPKGYKALGAFDNADRPAALDLLGFRKQLVFATFSTGIAFREDRPDLGHAAARAHNRGMSDFCNVDERLLGVAAIPLDDVQWALKELDFVLNKGLQAVWIPHRPCGGRSPGHNDLDPFWARLAEAGVPFVLHVGGDPLQLTSEWMNTGRPVPTDWGGGGENVRGKDMAALHQAAEKFLSVMILDGVFDRHPQLMGACVELGAGWVPQMLDRLDWVVDIWSRSDEALRNLTRKPSETARQHLAFTPYVYEDIGRLITQSDAELYLFSSDYPHTEGGRNPLGRFDASLQQAEIPEAAQSRFFADNFLRVFPHAAG